MDNDRTRLVLRRKLGESVLIDDTKLTLLKAAGGGYKFVIEASEDVRILRGEIADAIEAGRQEGK